MALQDFERRLERLVEGVFAKAFRGRLAPMEIARRVAREMDARRTVGVRGVIAPNRFVVSLSEGDNENFARLSSMWDDIAQHARAHAREEGYVFAGPVEVECEVDSSLSVGEFKVHSEIAESADGPAGSVVLGDGTRIRIGQDPVTIGRHPDCEVVFDDPEVSRQHAEIRRHEGGFIVVDLNSKNGTRVNGSGVRQRALEDGDEISVSTRQSSRVRFEAS